MIQRIITLALIACSGQIQAQQLVGNTWILDKSFITVGADTAYLYVRNGTNNIFDLSQISILFKPANAYSGTAVESSQQTGSWNLNGSTLTLDNDPGDYFPLATDRFLVSTSFLMLDTASGQFNIPARSHFLFTSVTTGLPVTVAAKVFLQGPYVSIAQLMHDSLRVQNRIPLTEPYSGLSGFAHVGGGGEQTTSTVLSVTGSNAIVDWVFLELRSAVNPTLVLATRSALLQRDGDVVDVDGVSPVLFNPALAPDYYYLTVRHRNHLGVQLAATKFYPKGVAVTTDFRTLPPEGFYSYNGLNPAQKLVGSKYTLWAGNGRIDLQLKYNGSNNDRIALLTTVGLNTPNAVVPGYLLTDYNLDGLAKYNGSANDRNVLLLNVGISTPSAVINDQVAR